MIPPSLSSARRAVNEFLAQRFDFDAGCAKEALAECFNFPGTDFGFAVKLRTHIVLFNAVAIDNTHLAKTLSGQVVSQLRTQRAGAADGQALRGQLRNLARAAVDRFVVEFVSHRRSA